MGGWSPTKKQTSPSKRTNSCVLTPLKEDPRRYKTLQTLPANYSPSSLAPDPFRALLHCRSSNSRLSRRSRRAAFLALCCSNSSSVISETLLRLCFRFEAPVPATLPPSGGLAADPRAGVDGRGVPAGCLSAMDWSCTDQRVRLVEPGVAGSCSGIGTGFAGGAEVPGVRRGERSWAGRMAFLTGDRPRGEGGRSAPLS